MRKRYDPVAVLGVPAHITIIYPFIPPEVFRPCDHASLEELFAHVDPFEFALADVRRFPQATYVAPNPAAPLVDLTEPVVSRFPQYPPYGGRFAEVIPHLTVADKSEAHAREAEAELTSIIAELGPIAATCSHVDLYESTTGSWAQKVRSGLGSCLTQVCS